MALGVGGNAIKLRNPPGQVLTLKVWF